MDDNERLIEDQMNVLRNHLKYANEAVTQLHKLKVGLYFYDNERDLRNFASGVPGHVVGRVTTVKKY